MKFLSKFIKPFKTTIILGVGFKSIAAFVDIALPLLLASVIDKGIGQNDLNIVFCCTIIMVGLTLLSLFSNIMASRLSAKASEGVGNDIRKALYNHKLTLSISDLKKYSYSGLTTRVVYDVDTISKFIGISMRMLVRCFILAIGGIFVAMTLDFYITLIVLTTMVLISLASVFLLQTTGKWFRKVSEGIDTSTAVIRESITGIKTIKSFAKQDREASKFNKQITSIFDAQVTSGSIAAVLSPTITLVSNMTLAVILFVSASRIEAGAFDPVRLTGFVVYLNLFILAMVNLSRMIIRYSKANASALRIHEILNLEATNNNENAVLHTLSNTDTALNIQNLSFRFDEANVISDVTFTLKKGQSLGIIGQTGCGKTTLVELLTGIYGDYTGEIELFGNNIKEVSKNDIAKLIGIARQKFDIFTDSIEKNIILDKKFDEKQFETAISNAQIKDFVLKSGKDLEIRQSGTNLSGGQRQRINLARLFYNNPEILVLDDVSSALDTTTNANLNKSLASLHGEKTVICISNKVDSIKNCDKIIVLENGKITGLDTHEELLKSNDCYKNLAENQFKGDVIYED